MTGVPRGGATCSTKIGVLSLPRVKSPRSRCDVSLALRVLSALVVWLSALGHVSGLAHFVLVSHHVCATHGELAHGGEHAHEPLGAAPTRDDTPSFTAAGEPEDEHGHCSVLARQQEQTATGSGVAAVLAPAAPPALTGPRLDALPHDGEAVLALAPKTSPPV